MAVVDVDDTLRRLSGCCDMMLLRPADTRALVIMTPCFGNARAKGGVAAIEAVEQHRRLAVASICSEHTQNLTNGLLLPGRSTLIETIDKLFSKLRM